MNWKKFTTGWKVKRLITRKIGTTLLQNLRKGKLPSTLLFLSMTSLIFGEYVFPLIRNLSIFLRVTTVLSMNVPGHRRIELERMATWSPCIWNDDLVIFQEFSQLTSFCWHYCRTALLQNGFHQKYFPFEKNWQSIPFSENSFGWGSFEEIFKANQWSREGASLHQSSCYYHCSVSLFPIQS